MTRVAGAIAAAMGLSVLLSGGSPGDVTLLSEAFGVEIETRPLPARG